MNSPRHQIAPEERLILALDFPSVAEARAVAEELRGTVRFYKIGLQLFPLGGVDLARELIARGDRVARRLSCPSQPRIGQVHDRLAMSPSLYDLAC